MRVFAVVISVPSCEFLGFGKGVQARYILQ